ncbi:unnamed protein product [Diplocarpon coronariae]
MDTNIEETMIGNAAMGSEEAATTQNLFDAKPVYKSFKKKYRKMKVKFDEVMRESNDLYLQEQRATSTIKRLTQENDQILDLLLEMNNSAQLPVEKRVDIISGLPELAPLFTEEDLASAAQLQTPEGKGLYNEICALLKERDATNIASKPIKSLATLLKTIPHPDLQTPGKAEEIEQTRAPLGGQTAPIGYLTEDQIEEYLDELDGQVRNGPQPPSISKQDFAFGNYHSPYNWLRRNQPHIFLQDGEGADKSHGRPGALRGAGKRASIPAPSKSDALEIVEEDGQGYDFALGGVASAKGKRKRDDEEASGGNQPSKAMKNVGEDGVRKKRAYNRKPKLADGETPPISAKKGKGRAKPKVPSPDPTAHPFGPPRI